MSLIAAAQLENSVLLDLYRTMQLVRKCELQLAKASQQGLVHGACHTYVGQEAVAAGVCAHLRQDDVVFSTHRGHGHALAKGVSPERIIAELYGRKIGCSSGRGGSMHLFATEVGLMGTSGIVGPSLLQAVLNAVQKCQPILVVCGHIHDSSGRSETIGSTPVINAGPKGVMWDVSG
jgi:TPP-dependent pyruvate/acetoin dehydrogenase alpha subunit